MKRFIFLILFFIITSCARTANEQVVRSGQLGYAFHAPKSEARNYQPLFILFHPAGSSGIDFLERWVPLLGKKGYLFAPTAGVDTPYGSKEFEAKVFSNIRSIQASYSTGDIVLIGESNGAIYGYQFLAEHPDVADVAVLISGVMESRSYEKMSSGELPQAKVLIVHGTEDQTFAIERAEDSAYKLKDINVDVELKKIDGMKHGADVFCEDEIIKWIEKNL